MKRCGIESATNSNVEQLRIQTFDGLVVYHEGMRMVKSFLGADWMNEVGESHLGRNTMITTEMMNVSEVILASTTEATMLRGRIRDESQYVWR